MIIRYGVYTKEKSLNGKVEIKANSYEDPEYHQEAIAAIRAKHPGWSIHGFCPDDIDSSAEAAS